MQTNQQFDLAFNLLQNTGTNLFLTGKAGTGKTTFLKRLKEVSPKRMIVVAPTGVAAINAGGVTIHSFFQLPFGPYIPSSPEYRGGKTDFKNQFRKDKINIIRSMDLLVIDEVSMVRADLLDAISDVLRRYKDHSKPFGGVQLLLIGDLQQLAPVAKDDEWNLLKEHYPSTFFFDSKALSESNYFCIELTHVYRQSDTNFINLLNNIRENRFDDETLQRLNQRYIPNFRPDEQSGYITLTTHNYQAQQINNRKLAELPGDPVTFYGEIMGDFPESSLPTSQELVLKPGAQIIFIKNDFDRRWVNGTIGVISGFDPIEETLYVITDDGKECDVKRESWRNIRYKYNEEKKQIEEEELGTFTQYPVRLAWAITVHKSQGLTFSRVVIDFTGGVFAGGQAYVALSRCTSLEGIQLKKPISRADVFVRPEIVSFSERFNNRTAIDRALKQAQADVQYVAAAKAFDKGDFGTFLDEFFKAIHSRYDIEKPNVQRLIRRKLNIINRLKEENRALKQAALEKEKALVKYAREYILMGDECLKHDMKEAAMKNYEKAVTLCPKFKEAWKKIKKLEKEMLKR